VQEGLEPTASEGMSTSGLIARSFKCSRRRWRMKGVLEKAKTRSIGVRQYPRRLCFAGASKRSLRELVQGLRSRLGRCFCALHRGVHRTPAPFSRNQHCEPKKISVRKTRKPGRFLGFLMPFFKVQFKRYLFPKNDHWGRLELYVRAILGGKSDNYMI